MAREFNIEKLFIGDDALIEMDLYDEDGNPLTPGVGWELEWVLRRGRSAPEATLTKANDTIGIIDGPNGEDTRARVTVDAADTAELEPDSYFHTLRRSDSGNKTTLSYGTVGLVWTAAR